MTSPTQETPATERAAPTAVVVSSSHKVSHASMTSPCACLLPFEYRRIVPVVPHVYDIKGWLPVAHTLVLRTEQFWGIPFPRTFARSRVPIDVSVFEPGSSSGYAPPVVKVLGLLHVPEHRGGHLVSYCRPLDHGALQCVKL